MNTSSISPNVVKTALDTVFFPEYEYASAPMIATAETSSVFNQDSASSRAVIGEVFEGTGEWTEKGEEEDIEGGTFRSKNIQTFVVTEFAKSLDVPRTFAADDQHSVVQRAVADMGRKGRMTRDNKAMALFRDAFTGSQFLTNDGKAIAADDHPVKGGVVDNKMTSALSESTLNDALVMMTEMKSQDNIISGCVAKTLLVAPKLFKTASEITRSTQRSGTANNDMNIYYSDLYNIEVRQSNFLGAVAGGSDTAWFLLGDNHMITRWVRESIWTDVVDWKFQRNNNYIYKAGYREVIGCPDYVGIVASTG